MGDANVTIQYVSAADRWRGMKNGSYDVLIARIPAMTESLRWDVRTTNTVTMCLADITFLPTQMFLSSWYVLAGTL